MKATKIGTFFLFAASVAAATASTAVPPPASATQPVPDLSSPRAALLAVYTAMRAGDVMTLKSCMIFGDTDEAEVFDIGVTQVCAPLRLMHAMEAKFGEAGRKPFDTSVEKSIDEMIARAKTAEISVDG